MRINPYSELKERALEEKKLNEWRIKKGYPTEHRAENNLRVYEESLAQVNKEGRTLYKNPELALASLQKPLKPKTIPPYPAVRPFTRKELIMQARINKIAKDTGQDPKVVFVRAQDINEETHLPFTVGGLDTLHKLEKERIRLKKRIKRNRDTGTVARVGGQNRLIIRSHYRKVKRGRVVVRSHVRRTHSGQQLFLGNMKQFNKNSRPHIMWMKPGEPGIFVGNFKIPPEQIEVIANSIGHEEMHHEINKAQGKLGKLATGQFDNISVPTMPMFNGEVINPKSATLISIPIARAYKQLKLYPEHVQLVNLKNLVDLVEQGVLTTGDTKTEYIIADAAVPTLFIDKNTPPEIKAQLQKILKHKVEFR